MIERINKNEERYDKVLKSVKDLEIALSNFNECNKDLYLLNKYYHSKNWIKDKDALENNKIPKVKAGVLSEDGVWNMLESIDELINDMKNTVDSYNVD